MEENKQIQTVDSTTEIVDVKGASNKLAALMEFVKENLKKGNDYMSIQGGKPSLMKSGAEKMNILVGYSAEYEKISQVMNPTDNYYYVEVKCTLRNKQGQKVAECLASCNNQEKARKNIAFADALNTVLKMAEKRAYVGATLNANALSQFYTQDLEDEQAEEHPEVVYGKKDITKDSFGAEYLCSACGTPISEKVAKFSVDKFGKMLCFNHQKDEKPLN